MPNGSKITNAQGKTMTVDDLIAELTDEKTGLKDDELAAAMNRKCAALLKYKDEPDYSQRVFDALGPLL